MQLGELSLPVIAVRPFSVDDGWTIASQDVIGGKPRQQWIAPGSRGITLSLFLHADYCRPQELIDQLRALAAAAEVLTLQEDGGLVHGDFLIGGVREAPRWTLPDGTLLVADVDVQLMESGDAAAADATVPQAVEGAGAQTGATAPTEDTSRPIDDVATTEIARV